MKKFILSAAFIVLTFVPVFAQQVSKPTLISTEPTAAQKQLINEGAKLHDRGLYADAIASYDKVLAENPTCIMAIYEKTLSLYYKKDFKQMLDLAYEGIKYKSNEIPLFYGLIANVYDDEGKPQKAVELYRQGISVLEGNTEYSSYLSSLYYNLGVTNFRQKQFKEARENLKKSVSLNFGYASPNHLLAQIYKGTGYKIPALLAAARLISLEVSTPRTKNSVSVFKEIMNGSSTKSGKGNVTIFMNPDAPKDEGDFTSFDLILGTLTAVENDADKNKDELDKFADAVDTVIGLLATDKKLSTTFIGKHYLPFMAEMKVRGYVKPFACLVLQQDGDARAEAWMRANEAKVTEFLKWSRNYKPF